jgi:hypothetical protein
MKNIFFLFSILLFSCNTKTSKKVEENIYVPPKITGMKYFDFDEIIHYKNEIESSETRKLYFGQKTKLDSLKYEIIINKKIPKTINDTAFINQLEQIGFLKNTVDKRKFEEINTIFKEKKHKEVYGFACDYIFRDILVFKRKSKTIGIAKICFECNENHIVGTEANIEEFGMDGDYEKLEKILEKK